MAEYVYLLSYVWDSIEHIGIFKSLDSAKERAKYLNITITNSRRKLNWKDMDDGNGYFVNNVSIAVSSNTLTSVYTITRYLVQE